MNYNKINEDFLDDQHLDVMTDTSDMRPTVVFDGTFKYPYVFKFIVVKDFFKDRSYGTAQTMHLCWLLLRLAPLYTPWIA